MDTWKVADSLSLPATPAMITKLFRCDGCDAKDVGGGIGGWSVNTQLWRQYSGDAEILCISCFELRLGRRLQASDFVGTKDNMTNAYVQLILKHEQGGT